MIGETTLNETTAAQEGDEVYAGPSILERLETEQQENGRLVSSEELVLFQGLLLLLFFSLIGCPAAQKVQPDQLVDTDARDAHESAGVVFRRSNAVHVLDAHQEP
jgi:hypothetical protein